MILWSANPKLPIHPSLTSSWQTQICFLCPVSHWILTKHWRAPLLGLQQMRNRRPRKAERPSWDQRIMQRLAVCYSWGFDLLKSSSEHMWTQNNHETISILAKVSWIYSTVTLARKQPSESLSHACTPVPSWASICLLLQETRSLSQDHICCCRAEMGEPPGMLTAASALAKLLFAGQLPPRQRLLFKLLAKVLLSQTSCWVMSEVCFIFSIIISPPNYHPVRSESSL